MSRLVIITHPSLVPGFHLAGVEAFSADNSRMAENLLHLLMDEEEITLVAIDDDLLSAVSPRTINQLRNTKTLLVSIPGSSSISQGVNRKQRITEMIHAAVGIHITFKGQEHE